VIIPCSTCHGTYEADVDPASQLTPEAFSALAEAMADHAADHSDSVKTGLSKPLLGWAGRGARRTATPHKRND